MKGKQANSSALLSGLYGELKVLRKQISVTGSDLDEEQIHYIRVLCKRLRAESLLLESKKQRAELKKLSKTLARYLAPARDAQVRLETFDLLVSKKKSSLYELRWHLERELGGCHMASAQVINLLECLLSEVKGVAIRLRIPGKGFIAAAKQKSFKRFKKLDSEQRDTYHDWRKSVKSFLYLLKVVPGGTHLQEYKLLKRLGDRLGQLHDLHVFAEYISLKHKRYLVGLQNLMDQREKMLLKDIHVMSAELYG